MPLFDNTHHSVFLSLNTLYSKKLRRFSKKKYRHNCLAISKNDELSPNVVSVCLPPKGQVTKRELAKTSTLRVV